MSSDSQPDHYANSTLKTEFERLRQSLGVNYPELANFLMGLLQKMNQGVSLRDIGYEITLHLTPAFFREHLSLFSFFQKVFHDYPELLGQESLTQIVCHSTFNVDHSEVQKSCYVSTFLLMVQSPVLEPQLTKNLTLKKASSVCFEAIQKSTFDLIANYLQTNNQVQINFGEAFDVFKFAASYRIKGLQTLCLKRLTLYFTEAKNLEQFCDFWIYSQHYQMADYNWVCFEIAKAWNADSYQAFSKRLRAKMTAIERIEDCMFDYARELEAFTASFRASRGLKLHTKLGNLEAVISSMHVSTLRILETASHFFKIVSLKASHAGLRDADAEAIGLWLNDCRTIQSLDLSFNHIGIKGAKALLNLLSENKTLKLVDMSHNPLGLEGAQLFVQGFGQNPTLLTLNTAHTTT